MADTLFKIPFRNTPERFEVELNGTPYIISNRWNPAEEGGWFFDLYDADENPLVMNVPLVTGADLLGQYEYVGLAGVLGVTTEGDGGEVPTLDNLGDESNLYYLVDVAA